MLLSDCFFATNSTTGAIWYQRGGLFVNNLVSFCRMERPTASTVPAWDMESTGEAYNSSSWFKCWAHGYQSDAAPWFQIRSTGDRNYDLAWTDLIGEQNKGGLIFLDSVENVTITNCRDWDQDDYVESILKFENCRNVTLSNSGRSGGGALDSGVYDVEALTTDNENFVILNCSPPDRDGGGVPKFGLHTALAAQVSGMEPRVVMSQNPGTIAAFSTTSATLVDVDAASLVVTFTAPPSGRVMVTLSAVTAIASSAVAATIRFGLREGAAIVTGSDTLVDTYDPAADPFVNRRRTAEMVVSGLTIGASYTYKFAWAVTAASGTKTAYMDVGGTAGAAIMKVEPC
jgi:hypothetical protein